MGIRYCDLNNEAQRFARETLWSRAIAAPVMTPNMNFFQVRLIAAFDPFLSAFRAAGLSTTISDEALRAYAAGVNFEHGRIIRVSRLFDEVSFDPDLFIDNYSLSAARSGVPLADIEWFFNFPAASDLPFTKPELAESYDNLVSRRTFAITRMIAFPKTLDYTLGIIQQHSIRFLRDALYLVLEDCEDTIVSDLSSLLTGELKAMGSIFTAEGLGIPRDISAFELDEPPLPNR